MVLCCWENRMRVGYVAWKMGGTAWPSGEARSQQVGWNVEAGVREVERGGF